MASTDVTTPDQNQDHPDAQSDQDITGERAALIPNTTLRAVFETGLIVGGLLAICFFLPHHIAGDGIIRFQAISLLLEHGKVSTMQYSMVGPAFSIPFWLLGKLSMTPAWWLSRYNLFVFATGLLVLYFLLRKRMDRGLIRTFFLVLIVASMFANHLLAYYGEVFTAILVAVGIVLFMTGRSLAGWSTVVLGVINTPASVVGLGCVVLKRALDGKRWRYILAFGAACGLILLEYKIRRGSFSLGGYDSYVLPAHTVMPYSGKQGFSYPFFFGLLSILFSFGKGLFFFAPGLLLPVRGLISRIRASLKKDLIPTGNVPCNGSCQRDCVATDCVRQARPKAVLRASDPTQPPVLQCFATASSQQNPPAHSSGRIGSIDLYSMYMLWISFLVGLVLVYSPWWAWYGGWFWGPRFFLFASIPASFALALRLHYRSRSLFVNVLTTAVFCLSLWVGINGALFDQQGLSICTANSYALELMCHYTLEYSVLWHPFVAHESITIQQLPYLAYSLIVFIYLAIPLLKDLLTQVVLKIDDLTTSYFNFKLWHF